MKSKIITIIFLFKSLFFYSQNQIGITIFGEAMEDRSGSSVSLSSDGSIVAIGSPHSTNINGVRAGQVKIYKDLNGVWTQIGDNIIGDNEFDTFGTSIDLSSDGTVIAIGAPYQDSNSSSHGYVKIFKNINDNWVQIGSNIQGENSGDTFGYSLALSSNGSIIAIGAPNNDVLGNQTGHVKVYENNGGVWNQVGSDIEGENDFNFFGGSVKLSSNGNTLAIGAKNGAGVSNNGGHVKVFSFNGNSWTQLGDNINGGNELTYDFGYSLSLSSTGSILAISDPFSPNNTGTVRVYEYISNNWIQIGSDIIGDDDDFFGSSVSISSDGSIIAIGSTGGVSDLGHGRVYKFIEGEWTQIGANIDSDNNNNGYGNSLSLSSDGNIIAVGANFAHNLPDLYVGYTKIYNLNQVLNIEDNNYDNLISIYPNPVDDIINISKLDFNSEFEIYSILGNKILNGNLTDKIDVTNLKPGIYLLKTNQTIKRFIKK